LFCHQRFDIAYRRDVRAMDFSDFLYVCIGDLAAANNRNFQNRTLVMLCSRGCEIICTAIEHGSRPIRKELRLHYLSVFT
jgi:hypothetical protein